ncbi:MAG: type VI secretion system accessory protein TagJ [bacterium]
MDQRQLATDCYFQGRLAEAVEAQLGWVRDHPMDVGARLFLIELFSFSGEWDRAERQLGTLLTNQAEADVGVQLYLKCLASERKRARAMEGGQPPDVLGKVTEAMQWRMEALKHKGQARAEAIAKAVGLEQAAEAARPFQLNGQSFVAARDGDDLLGPVLEVFAQGEYFWVDISQVQLISAEKPKYPRDLIWLPARLEMENDAGNVLLPLIYAGSSGLSDQELRLGRATDWQSEGESGLLRGQGQKEWFFDGETAVAVVQWRDFVRE